MKFQSQKVAYYFFATCMLLLSLQLVYGFIMAFAHMGYDVLHNVIPFNTARTTHTNLLVVWLLTGFMGAAYYIIPEESGRELYNVKLAYVQLAALVIVGVVAIIGFHVNWWEGRKFLEIPRPLDYLVVVDVLLFMFNIGMTIWLGKRHTTTAIVLFFGLLMAALLYLPGMIDTDNQTLDSYWRWWVVHLWVEGFFEVFATVIFAFLFARLGLLEPRSTERAVVMSSTIFLSGGIIGTLHHLYFSASPAMIMALGSVFSALEVVPLVFIGYEAWEHLRLSRHRSWVQKYRYPIYFFVAVAFWNMVGAGLFGFMINPPIALYYMQGLNTTPVHGHTALFGVYGMLGIGLMLFCLRGLSPLGAWSDRLLGATFWLLNVGLAMMVFISLVPAGIYQAWASVAHGLWFARSAEVVHSGFMETLVWLRVPGDVVFALGTLTLAWFALRLLSGSRLDVEQNPSKLQRA